MPELSWVGGYPVILGTMALACGSLYRYFRRSGWL
jgi:magnesium transporter